MNEMMILAQTGVSEQDVVTPFEQNLLVILVFVIMFGLGAGLTPKDFRLAFRRPWGLVIGWVTQFGLMPLLTFGLISLVLFQLPLEYAAPVALGALLMGSVPAGTTSNIFTYFSKGNLALSVIMTTHSTLWALLMTPLVLVLYAGFSLPTTQICKFLYSTLSSRWCCCSCRLWPECGFERKVPTSVLFSSYSVALLACSSSCTSSRPGFPETGSSCPRPPGKPSPWQSGWDWSALWSPTASPAQFACTR